MVVVLGVVWVPLVLVCGGGACTLWLVFVCGLLCVVVCEGGGGVVWGLVWVGGGVFVCDSGGFCGLVCVFLPFLFVVSGRLFLGVGVFSVDMVGCNPHL